MSLSWSLLTALSVQPRQKAESSGEFDLCLRCACTEQQHEPVESRSPAGGDAGRSCTNHCTVSTKALRGAALLASLPALRYSHGLRTMSGAAAAAITLHCSSSKAGLLRQGGSRLGQHVRRDTCRGTHMGRAELPHIAAA